MPLAIGPNYRIRTRLHSHGSAAVKEQEDTEGPRPRRLARVLMTLAGYGFFGDDDHAEAIAVLYGVPVVDLETEGMRRAGQVVAFLAPALASP